MKKFLLSACTGLLSLTAMAQVPGTLSWSAALSPASEASALYRRAPMAVAADGSVFATGSFDQSITIGSTTLEPIATSSYLAKYSDSGNALWAVALRGAATITAVDADAEGNVYIAGTFADEVIVGSTDDKKVTIKGKEGVTEKVSAFIAKYDANGQIADVRTFLPSGEDAGTIGELSYTPEGGDVFLRPNKLQVAGGKVYVSLFFTGNFSADNVNWMGRYLNVFDFMASDLASAGVFSLTASGLTDATPVALFQNKEQLSAIDVRAEDVNFIVEGETVYATFVGAGDKVLTTPAGKENIALTIGNDGSQEHSIVLAAIGATTTTTIFHNTPHDKQYSTDLVRAMAIKDNTLFLGGTFYNALPFHPETTSQGSADQFVAAIDKRDFSVQWATASGINEGDETKVQEVMTGMLVKTDGVYVTGYIENKSDRTVVAPSAFNFSASGAATLAEKPRLAGATATNGTLFALNFIDGLNTQLEVYNVSNETSVSSLTATTDAPTAIFTLEGKRIATDGALPAGIYLVKTGDVVRKQLVK